MGGFQLIALRLTKNLLIKDENEQFMMLPLQKLENYKEMAFTKAQKQLSSIFPFSVMVYISSIGILYLNKPSMFQLNT